MGTTRIYIGGLNPRVREDDVSHFVKGFGTVKEIILKNGFSFVEFDDHRDAADAAHDLNGRELVGNKVSVELARGLPRGRDRFHDFNAKYDSTYNDRGYGRRGRNDYGRNDYGRSDYGRSDRYRGGGGGGGFDRRGYRSGGGGGGGGYGPRQPLPSRTPHRLVVQNLASGISWQDLKDFMRQAGEVMFADVFNRKNEGVVEFASLQDMRNALDRLDGREFMGRKVKLAEERSRDSGRRSPTRRSRSQQRSSSRSNSSSRSRTRSRSRNRKLSRSSRDSRSRSVSETKKNAKSKSKSPKKNQKSEEVEDSKEDEKKTE